MSKAEAIDLARRGYAAYPEFFHKLRPRFLNGAWVVECLITAACGWICSKAEDFDAAVADMLDAGRRWA